MKYKNLKYTFNIIGLAVVMFLAIKEFCYLILSRIPFSEGSLMPIVLSIAVFIVSCLVPTVAMENLLGLHPKLFRKSEPVPVGFTVMYGYLLILAAGIVNNLILTAISLTGIKFAPRELAIPEGAAAGVLYFIYICILPPVLEEIFLRGYVLNALKGYGQTFAVITSSVCFALMHSSLENFPVYFACGILLALVYLTFDSLLPAMALHCLNNSISFFLAYFRQRVNAISALSMTVYIYISVLILGFAGYHYLSKHGIKLTACLVPDSDIRGKTEQFFKSYIALAAFGLLIFFGALGSYNNLV